MHDRYRSLDTLRASAIGLVITAHSVLAYGAPTSLAPLQLGGIGVDLFFVLSGWLLGGQLIRELENTGTIQLRRFWIRRWMRTLPAYYAVLLLTMAEQALSHPDKSLRLDYLVFLQNYTTHLPYFFVSWSLCVEEHFYLFIAPALLLLGRLGGFRWIVMCALLILPLLFRTLGWFTSPDETHVRWDGCMLGVALAACQVTAPKVWTALSRSAPLIAGGAVVLLLINLIARWWPQLGWHDYDKLVYALIFGSFVVLASRNAWWQEHLYLPGAHYVAVRSYSLYLIHPEILALMKRFGGGLPFPVFCLLTWAGSCLLAECLYQIIERPFMAARERLAVARSV
jgi:peptidoglycan/LPS O-acetylase OafA/YrhL